MNAIDVLREALADAEHNQFGHDPGCRSLFAEPGECNCALSHYASARTALALVESLADSMATVRRLCAEGHGDDLIAETADAALRAVRGTDGEPAVPPAEQGER